MELGGKTWAHQGDQWVRCTDKDQSDQQQSRAHHGVESGENMSTLLPGPAAEHAHHGAVERAIDAAEQDQQKARQHVRVVVGVVGRSHPKGRRDHQLAHQAAHFAEQGAVGHHQGNALQGSRHC